MEKTIKNKKIKGKIDKEMTNSKKELGKFLKEHIITKAKILSTIGVILWFLIIVMVSLSDFKITDEITSFPKTAILSALKERTILLLLVVPFGLDILLWS